MMEVGVVPSRRLNDTQSLALDRIVIGKDVLELVSSAMYIDPLTIYREYVQNAADALDEARARGLLASNESAKVTIDIDVNKRKVTIRDNGTGIATEHFGRRLTSLGASMKRGASARGFRGVGRLAGLGYAQRLTFRSRAPGEENVSEITWDCRVLRAALRASEPDAGVENLIRSTVTLSRRSADGFPPHFFEVELDGVVRLRNDRLMNPVAIADYLSQVAPVPFASEFVFAEKIRSSLAEKIPSDALELRVSGLEGPIFRPHRLGFSDEKKRGEFREIEIFDIPDVEGGLAATAWILHHDYDGAIPTGAGFKGIRFRSGNLQIGGNALLEELFTEPRFNGWAIGEIHVLDRRIVPNARRDDFEQNAHYSNLMNQLAPIARSISKRCRTSSKRRQLLRDFELQEHVVRERVQILGQGGLRQHAKKIQAGQIEQALDKMSRLTAAAELQDESEGLIARTAKLREKAGKALQQAPQSPLELLPPHKRSMYGQMIELIYDCSTNRSAAKSLVDRILSKITSDPAEPTPAQKTKAIRKKPAATTRSTTRGQEKKRPKRRGTR